MTAVAFRLRSGLRSRWASALGLTLIVAVLGAVVLALAAGAHRTMTAPNRYTDSFEFVPDALVTQEAGASRSSAVASLPDVDSVSAMTWVFGLVVPTNGRDVGGPNIFSGSYKANGVLLVDGRDTDPQQPGEFVASKSFVEDNHLSIGDTFDLITLTQDEADQGGFTDPSSFSGPHVVGTLVGVFDGAGATLQDPTPTLIFSPALLKDYPGIGTSATIMAVGLQRGSSLEAFREQVATLPESTAMTVAVGELVSAASRRAINTQALGLWLLALAAGIAAIAVLGQIVTRTVRLSAADREDLGAVGYTNGQMLAESMCRAGVPIVGGSMLAAVLAIAPSGAFPTGFVRRLELHPGAEFDSIVLILGGVVLAIALLLWTFVSLAMARLAARVAWPSALVEALATRTSSATAATGARFVFTRRRRDVGTPRAALAGVMLTAAALSGAIVFGVSMSRLVTQPARYGSNFDAVVGDDGAASLADETRQQLVSDANVTGLVWFASTFARLGAQSMPVVGFQVVKGGVQPVIVAGRLPAGDDEVAVGRLTADDLGIEVGQHITLQGPTGQKSLHVTGLAVVSGLGSIEGVGEGSVMTLSALHGLDSNAAVIAAGFRVQNRELAARTMLPPTEDGSTPKIPPMYVPEVIANIDHVRPVPFLLAGVLGVLTLLIAANAMLVSLRGRRRDLAVLRALGADGAWVTRTVHWQATIFVLVPVTLGMVLGVIAGRLVFTKFADNVGTVDHAATPLLLVIAVVAAIVLIANVMAILPGRQARRDMPAAVLQTE